MVDGGSRRGAGRDRETRRIPSVDDEPACGLVAVETSEVIGGEVRTDVPREDTCVIGTDGEEDLVACVRGDALREVAGQLSKVLVREGQRESIAAGFGEN